jgi:hypothetical protein
MAKKAGKLVLKCAFYALVGALIALNCVSCGGTDESRLRKKLATQTTGSIQLPAGLIEISSELVLAPGAHDLEIVGSGTLFKVSDDFKGRAVFVAEHALRIRFRDFSINGNRAMLDHPAEMAPPENYFRLFYSNNGLLIDNVEGVEIFNVQFSAIPSFAAIISRSENIKIRNVVVEDSGTRNAKLRNNTTGGIVIEEGSSDFEVKDSQFRRIRGNGLWTHSLRISPRVQDGVFAANRFEGIGRDAIQVGHAQRVRVEQNTGIRIGYPPEEVDVENGGIPVAIDTAGDVDHSSYERNSFEEVDGKCIDLDGFHDGAVIENKCVNLKPPTAYPFGNIGIVLNNTNPSMHSQNVEIRGNVMDGTKFGGLFLIGSGHTVIGNSFLHINKAGCNESHKQFGCIWKADEPEMLESGIYLTTMGAREEPVRGNVIRDNKISGFKMKSRCITAGPGVKLKENVVGPNTCQDYTTEPVHPLHPGKP